MADKINDRDDLKDAEIALMDAIKTVMEIMFASGVAPTAFASSFAYQRDAYLGKKMPTAAAVMEMLRQFAADPQRAEHRESARKILREPPKGTA